MQTIDWYGLHGERWGEEIVQESLMHPAKFARGLIRQMYYHALVRGWIKHGDAVLDPFAGVALGALDAMRNGLVWFGVELEPKFYKLGLRNIELWNERYAPVWPEKWGSASIINGDSRELSRYLLDAGIAISSPPYGEMFKSSGEGPGARYDFKYHKPDNARKKSSMAEYGDSEGQLAKMPYGDVDAVLSSQPFLDARSNTTRSVPARNKSGPAIERHGELVQGYAESDGNLMGMREGNIDAVVSSPPYRGKRGDGGMTPSSDYGGKSQYRSGEKYGQSDGQLGVMEQGNLTDESGLTFWSAARQIVEQTYDSLAPDGVAMWVVKAYAKNKEVVDFPDQWRRLSESVGFETIELIRAWLVEERGSQYDLFGDLHKQTVERKSFFRKLYETKYPENRIDYEIVVVQRK